jgi:Spy/CpxP family protein refolding chaperone
MKISLTPVLLGLFLFTTAAFGGLAAEEKPDGRSDRRENRSEQRLEKMKQQLQLSDAQFEKIKAIHAKYAGERKTKHAAVSAARKAAKELLTAETLDRGRIRASLEETARLRIDLRMLMVDQRLEMETVLTPEQKKLLREKIKARKNKKDRGSKRKHEKKGKRGESDARTPR